MTGVQGWPWLLIGVPVLVGVLLAAVSAMSPPALATSSYAEATGQRCATCHVGPPGQGVLTADGQRFAAVPSHRTDPAGAWAVVVGSGATGAPVPAPSRLPRTGEGQSAPVAWVALCIGLALITAGGVLAAGGYCRRSER
jgi:hypothetical protein